MKFVDGEGRVRSYYNSYGSYSSYQTMPIHLNGVLMTAPVPSGHRPPLNMHQVAHSSPGTPVNMGKRTSSLEVLNNSAGRCDFEEKRAIIASALSLNDLLKPTQDYRATSPNLHRSVGTNGYLMSQSILPQSILNCKPNTNGYNVNFLNNGTLEKDLDKKANGLPRSNSLGSGSPMTPPLPRKSKLHALGRLFKPWKWKRKKKSPKFEAASKSLERKISVRSTKEGLIQRGILLPISPVDEESTDSPRIPPYHSHSDSDHEQTEPNKDKTEHSNGSVPVADPGVVNHSPKSCGPHPAQDGGGTPHGGAAPPGSVPLPGLTGHRILNNGSVTVSVGGASVPHNGSTAHYRTPLSPETESPPTPVPPPAPHRPVSLVKSPVNEAVNPLSIDPNERISTPGMNGHPDNYETMQESIGVTDIGVIPPPPMFSSPSPPPPRHPLPPVSHPPPHLPHLPHPPHLQHDMGNHMSTSVTTAIPHDLSDTGNHFSGKAFEDDDDEDDLEEQEADDEFGEMHGMGAARLVTTVPAKEPAMDAQPLKSALKKAGRGSRDPSSSPPSRQGTSLPGSRSTRQTQFAVYNNTDKENILPNSDEDEDDGPILYRDEDNMEDEDRLAAKLARKESLSMKLEQRPTQQELIDKNILYQMTEEERRLDRSIIGAKLIRRLSLRPTPEELEDKNILKKTTNEEMRKEREEKKRYLLRKLSFRPTLDELKTKKIIKFNDYIEVTPCHEYDRRADKPWTRLTPKDKASIRKELNDFKSSEMAVHDDSRHLTRFHRP